MLLLLVRHGTTDLTERRLVGRLPGVHLNSRGRGQAESAAALVATLDVSAVYTSPLERAQETAAPLAERLGLAAVVKQGLLEVDYGEWTNMEFKALRKTELWKVVQQRPAAARFPGGESLREAQARVVTAIETLAVDHRDGIVAAYSHADPIRLAVAHFAGVHLDLYQRLSVSPGSVTALALGGAHPVLLRMSETGSLEELKPRKPRSGKN